MDENESIRIGSIIEVPTFRKSPTKFAPLIERAEVIGYVVGKGTQIRVQYADGFVELLGNLTIDNIKLIKY